MCGRFEVNISREKLIEKFGITHWRLEHYRSRFNIPPGTFIPIIRQSGDSRIASPAHWGLIPSWSKDRKIAYRMFNARSETVAEKPSFRAAYKRRRCLIPATAYYEWQKRPDNAKQPYRIARKDGEPFAMAGLYEDWTDTESGELIESCTIITRPAWPEIGHLHDRMPVILPDDQHNPWLECHLDDFPTIPASQIDYYPIASDVGSPENDYLFERIDD